MIAMPRARTLATFLPATNIGLLLVSKNIGLLLVSGVRSPQLSRPRFVIVLPSDNTGYQSAPGQHVPHRARLIPSAASHHPRLGATPERLDAAARDAGSLLMVVEWGGPAITQTADDWLAYLVQGLEHSYSGIRTYPIPNQISTATLTSS
jgi:hypothetical protein